jgi:hypothetical protein
MAIFMASTKSVTRAKGQSFKPPQLHRNLVYCSQTVIPDGIELSL